MHTKGEQNFVWKNLPMYVSRYTLLQKHRQVSKEYSKMALREVGAFGKNQKRFAKYHMG